MKQLRTYFEIFAATLLAGTITLVSTTAVALENAWQGSINPETKERYLPVELWAGAEWDGKRELKMPRVEGTYRHGKRLIRSKGPRNGNIR
jgi:hypothetical protein